MGGGVRAAGWAVADGDVPFHVFQEGVNGYIGGTDQKLGAILKFKEIALGVEADGIAAEVAEALPVQAAGEAVRPARLQVIKELQGGDVGKVLVSGGEQASAGPSGQGRFEVGGEKRQAGLFDETDGEVKGVAGVEAALQLIDELDVSVVGVKACLHLPFPAGSCPRNSIDYILSRLCVPMFYLIFEKLFIILCT